MTTRVSLNLPLSPITTPPKLSASLPPIPSHKFNDDSPKLSTSYYQESDIFEDMPVTLVLPDGDTFNLVVKTGETVQEIKRKLDTLHGIPYSEATLYYNGACMIDPLSLNDFPGLVRKSGVSLDVKISSWKPKDNGNTRPPSQPRSQSIEYINNNQHHKNDFIDNAKEMVTTSSVSSLHSISFVEYVDTPHRNNTISPNSYEYTHQQTLGSLEGSPPPLLPNAAFSDSPTMGDKLSRRRQDPETRTGTTTIDVHGDDDDDPQCKEIQKLGGNKRWKLCFLF